MSRDLKQVILVRRDLKMRRSALAALTARASSEFFLDNNESDRSDVLTVNLSSEEAEWISGGSKRIVLGVPSEGTLRNMAFKAELAGISCYLITGRPTETHDEDVMSEALCIALGPDESSKIDEITGNLKLF